MARFRQLLLILIALILSGGQLFASSHEQRDFASAAAAFQDKMWDRADAQFAQFIQNHPDSARAPEAVLMQAQAEFNQGKLPEAIALLQSREDKAGTMADQYVYWIGQAQFQSADYSDAADTFAQLASGFPNSQWRMNALVNEASARAKLGQWDRVKALLQNTAFFQDAVKTNATDDRVLNGRLLLAEAFLAENHADSAMAVLESAAAFGHKPELNWQRLHLLGHAELADGDTNQALSLTTNLIAAAIRANRPDLSAQSVAEQADVLEKMGRLSDAVSVYFENLTNGAPDDWQRQSILKIAELSAAQTNFLDAEDSLESYLSRYPNSPQEDSIVLALGELHLKSYVAWPLATNSDLSQAQTYFNQFIGTYTNSPLLGKAYLDRGWCFWVQENWAPSAADFQAAVERLPVSVDLAVAHFKLGDAEFRLNQLAAAREDYETVVNDFTNYPVVGETLGAQSLYQTLRVCLQLQDFSGASNSLSQILKIYPVSNVAEKSILLVGEALSDLGQPVNARALFQKFEQEFPSSSQLPDVELAIARTYEQENNWPQAISIYDSWVTQYTGSAKLPAVQYARAWANFQGGYETNAFLLFTNFLVEYPSNALLTPVAQWWLGDYYSGRGDWANAEKNYEMVFQNWPNSELAYPAKLMAGRAAMGRQGYEDAKYYFLMLTSDTNCPPQLDAQAMFAYGDVLMQQPSSDTNNPLANFKSAIPYFQLICQQYAGSEQAALAYGEIGDCYLQLATQAPHFYDDATNAYSQVMAAPSAEIPERSKAQLGIGLVFEKRAALDPENQTLLLQAALDNYLDVFFGSNLRDGETADPFSVKEAGLHALPLVETLGMGDPNKFIDQMEVSFPQMKDLLEKKRLEISRPKIQ